MHMFELCIWFGLTVLRICNCELSSYYRLGVENKAVDKLLNSTQTIRANTELECYIQCMQYQRDCCTLEIKKEESGYHCSMYSHTVTDTTLKYENGGKIASRIGCRPATKVSPAKDCKSLKEQGVDEDGEYQILVNDKPKNVYCDMTTDDGGWTIIQKRFDGSVNFQRTWQEYKDGFGNNDGEHWLGNELIHQLTKGKTDILFRMEGTDFNGVTKHLTMKGFWIGDEASKYKLNAGTMVDGATGLDSWFLYSDGLKFSTYDQDNDITSDNCSQLYGGGGWWFKHCLAINPNGLYGTHTPYQSAIWWRDFVVTDSTMKTIKIQIK